MNTLRKRGFTVEFSDDGHDFSSWRSRLILPVGDVLSEKGRRVGFHLWQAMTLREKLKRADLIFATADSSALPLLRDKAKRRLSAPIVYATIGLAESFPDRRGWIYRYYKELAASADALIHYGEAEGRGLIERFGVPRERVHFVPFGVDTAFYDKAPSYDGPPIALGIDPRRDWPLLARALQGTGITMRVYTNPDLLRGINPPAEFERHAPVPSDVVADLLAEAAFVVLPVVENSYTGATITLLSAMAAGKAVIVSRTAAIKDGYGLVNGQNCVLVPPGDEEALRSAILSLSGDIGRCRAIGENAGRHVRRFHDISVMADRFAEIFRGVLS